MSSCVKPLRRSAGMNAVKTVESAKGTALRLAYPVPTSVLRHQHAIEHPLLAQVCDQLKVRVDVVRCHSVEETHAPCLAAST